MIFNKPTVQGVGNAQLDFLNRFFCIKGVFLVMITLHDKLLGLLFLQLRFLACIIIVFNCDYL